MQPLIEALTIIIPLAAIMVTLFAWLRQDIKAQGERIDIQGKELNGAIKAQGGELRQEIKVQGDELRQEIKAQGERLDKRIDIQGKELSEAIKTQGDELRLEIKVQGERHDKRIDEQGKDIRTLIAEVSALKATVETFFRLRVDPHQPPDNPGAAQANKVA